MEMHKEYVYNLKCEYLDCPIGIIALNPRLSWQICSERNGWEQSAFRILASSSLQKLNSGVYDFWDSGKVISEKSVNNFYAGLALHSRDRVYWKVQVWDQEDKIIESNYSFWEMGLLKSSDWVSNWIGMGKHYLSGWAFYLRKEFATNKKIINARSYVCGLGYYELSINGRKVGDHVLDPAQTDYPQRVFYNIFDITNYLEHGNNAVGMTVGDGWYHQSRLKDAVQMPDGNGIYGEPTAIVQIIMEYDDGTFETIISDNTWKAFYSPIVLNNVYAGETYDARLEKGGWDLPGFDDSDWFEAVVMKGPKGSLVPQTMPPIKRSKVLDPVSITQPRRGIYIYDFGENIAGWIRLNAKGYPGTEITIRYSEMLDLEGQIHPQSCGTGYHHFIQTDRYIKKGNETEVWEPRFTYHGFRYIEVSGYPGTPDLNSIQAVKVHTALKETGVFDCSNYILNGLHKMVKNTITSNIHGVPTDCPAREKCGWTGDALVIAETVMYNYSSASLWEKYMGDIDTSRKEFGTWTAVAPGKRNCLEAAPAWGTAQVMIPWYQYQFYADESILKDYYDQMKEWVYYLLSNAGNDKLQEKIDFAFYKQANFSTDEPSEYILYYGLDDWAQLKHSILAGNTVPQISTAFFYLSAITMKEVASILGNVSDSEEFEQIAKKIKNAYINKFFNYEKHTFGTLTLDCFSLCIGIIPEEEKSHISASIGNMLSSDNYHIRVGHVGTRFLFDALSDAGNQEAIKNIINQKTFPSFGYQMEMGATTLWELWEGGSSLNHIFKGGFDSWIYSHVLGITMGKPGFKEIIIQPDAFQIFDFAKGHYDSVYGKIAVEWKKDQNKIRMAVAIPPNTTAKVYLPIGSSNITLPKFSKMDENSNAINIGSGKYLFWFEK